VYLQVARPGMFVRPTTPHAQHASPEAAPVPPPVAEPASAAAESTTANDTNATAATSAPQSANAHAPTQNRTSDAAPRAEARPTSAVRQDDGPSAREASPARKPIPTSAIIAGAADAGEPITPAEHRVERAASRKSAAPREAQPAHHSAKTESREHIAVSPATSQARVNAHVSEGYALLQAGNLAAARAMYTRAIEAEPLEIDALLGLAYIAAQENRSDEALRTYLRILQLNPRHAIAQAALIGLMGRADPAASETRLKQLLSREPSAFLHFVLGNLYSDQSLWSQAQQAYFQAHHLEPDNPDYAYNLAVALDHLRQSRLALEFYQRAEQRATLKGRASFDVSHARARVSSLSSELR
jgi:Tfp pilus assembly protein PilF